MQIHAYTCIYYVLFTAYTKLLYMKPVGTVINKGLKPRPKWSQRGSSWTKLGRPLKSGIFNRGSNLPPSLKYYITLIEDLQQGIKSHTTISMSCQDSTSMLRKARFRKKGEQKKLENVVSWPQKHDFHKALDEAIHQDMIQFIPDKRYHPGRKNYFPHFMSRKKDVYRSLNEFKGWFEKMFNSTS